MPNLESQDEKRSGSKVRDSKSKLALVLRITKSSQVKITAAFCNDQLLPSQLYSWAALATSSTAWVASSASFSTLTLVLRPNSVAFSLVTLTISSPLATASL